ncbi:MAG TPA: hypothetical protein VMM79_19850 [Longimicrobiales bacterium]|jgi:hypothetical protein|nr:hypothetical protein [Longimicrobiales bacterium]
MRRQLCVGVILLLGLGATAIRAEAQTRTDDRDRGFQLFQNYPNPFNPVTRIPFYLGPELFDRGQPVRVTIRIFGVLHQLVAVPTALDHAEGNGARIENLEYASPGQHVAYWDGLDRNGNEVGSGLYIVLLEVNGRKARTLKMTVSK